MSHKGETVEQGHYLGFTFDGEDFKRFRRDLRAKATGVYVPGQGMTKEKLPVEKRWSARHFSLDTVFQNVIIDKDIVTEVPWYYKIDNWQDYCDYISSSERKTISRPYKKILSYHEYNGVGIDDKE